VERLLHHTDKAIVGAGTRGDEPVVVKLLTTDHPYWTGRRDHELAVYRHLATDPPAVTTPQLRYADDRLTVLSRLPGNRLGDERHLTDDLSDRTVEVVLDALDAFAAWMPHPRLPEPTADYHERVAAEHAAGQLDDTSRARLQQLVDSYGQTRVVAHGDPLPANLLPSDSGCAVLDFEHCGRYALVSVVADRAAGRGVAGACTSPPRPTISPRTRRGCPWVSSTFPATGGSTA